MLVINNLNAQMRIPYSPGEYCIGKTKLFLTDSNRVEWFTKDPTIYRNVVIDVWYPGTCLSQKSSSYVDQRVVRAFAKSMFSDSINFSRLTSIQIQSMENIQVTTNIEKHPVVIFSPGSKIPVALYTSLLQQLATNGYFVFAVSHFHSTPLVLPDGTFVPRNDQFFEDQFTSKVLQEWEDLQSTISGKENLQEKVGKARRYLKNFPATLNTRRLSGDILFLIQELEKMNHDSSSPFFNKLDLDNIGGLGHSFGGAIIGQACLSEAKIKAGINLDGWQFGDMIYRSFQTPFLLVRAGSPNPQIEFNDIVFSHLGHNFSQIWIKNTTHTSFTDLPYFAGELSIPNTGNLDPYRNFQIISKIIMTFFDHHLMQENRSISALIDEYPEITISNSR